MRCILSVYYTGEKSRFFGSPAGEDYADETMEIMEFLEEGFGDNLGWFDLDYPENLCENIEEESSSDEEINGLSPGPESIPSFDRGGSGIIG